MGDSLEYDKLSVEELTQKMNELKETCRLDKVVFPEVAYAELGGNFIPVGLDDPAEIVYRNSKGVYGSMTSDEATEILKRDHELRVERDLEARGITRQDVKGFLEYLVMSASLDKKLHPELYEGQ